MSSIPSPDAKAVVRAAEALTTQVRRIADALSTPVVRYDVATDDTPTPGTDDARHAIVADNTILIAHWHPAAEQHAEERQELAGMVGEFIDAQMRMAQVSDEETERTARRESIGILISRAGRGVITGSESELLRQWVETELREADTAREVARGNLRHVREIVPELEKAQAAIERARAECKAIAHEVYGQHDEDDDGKREAVGRVIAALDGTEQPTTEPGFTEQHANPDIIGTTEGP